MNEQAGQGGWMEAIRGQHVTVLTHSYGEEKSDTGTLLRISDGWLQVVKDNGEMILIPSTAIRLVKLLDLTHRATATERLLQQEHAPRAYVAATEPGPRPLAPDEAAVL
ncbi:MAG TPA: hypothetical protein VKT77_04495 [Chthonomonadaceae bacterium]|nr:hypothetical protein [Chthonomonadaceae bacterium]